MEVLISQNPWTTSIAKLCDQAETQSSKWRRKSYCFSIATAVYVFLVVAFVLSPYAHRNGEDVKWAIARLSVLILIAAVLLAVSRVSWNHANVWLGRAGTLEDLVLALRLIGQVPGSNELPPCGADSQSTVLRQEFG